MYLPLPIPPAQRQLIKTNIRNLQPFPHLSTLIEETGWCLYLIATSTIPVSWNSSILRPYLPAVQAVPLQRHLRITSLSCILRINLIRFDSIGGSVALLPSQDGRNLAWKKAQLKARILFPPSTQAPDPRLTVALQLYRP